MNKYLSLIIVACLLSGPASQTKCVRFGLKNPIIIGVLGAFPVACGLISYFNEKKLEEKSFIKIAKHKEAKEPKKVAPEKEKNELPKENSFLVN